MRKLSVLLFSFVCALVILPGQAQELALDIPPAQLVREVVYNELHDHQEHGYWRYWIERRSANGEAVEQQVETAGGPVALLELGNGRPLNQDARRQEQQRIHLLLTSPQEQASHLRHYRQDEDRIGHFVALLPDAFLFDFDDAENGCYRLRFHPNPAYASRSTEARILQAMSGTLWIDARYKHLARLDGHIDHNVDFGFGILGRLYQGGWFQLQRVRVSPTDWKTEHLEVHMNIRALLVTSFARETSEQRGGFTPVPAGISLAEGIALLEQSEPIAPAPDFALAAAAFPPGR